MERQSETGNFKFKLINNNAAWDKIDNKVKINFYGFLVFNIYAILLNINFIRVAV